MLQMNSEKLVKTLEQQLGDLQAKLDESGGSLSDMESLKAKMNAENSDLLHQLEEAESQINQLNRQKQVRAKRPADVCFRSPIEGVVEFA